MDQSKSDQTKIRHNIIERQRDFSDLSTVESQKDNLLPEEFPDGPYGSPVNLELEKDTPYLESQRSTSAFTYEDKEFHEGIKRLYPEGHPTHDDRVDNHEDQTQ